jgi:predicted TIM-barrel fold metal-dependent hydrolase
MLDLSGLPLMFDCHVHVPSLDGRFAFSWAPTSLTCQGTIRYLDRLNIRGAVLMSSQAAQATTADEQATGNRELLEVLRMYPGRFTAGITVNGNWPQQSIEEMRYFRREHGLAWLGECVGYIGKFSYDGPGWWRILDEAAKLDMIVHAHCTPAEMDRFAERYPQTTFVYPHFPSRPDLEPLMQMLQRRPNVHFDICGAQYVRMGLLEWAVRTATADRVLFGSDLTICDPATVIARVAFAEIEDDAKRAILGRNCLAMLARRGVSFPGLSRAP